MTGFARRAPHVAGLSAAWGLADFANKHQFGASFEGHRISGDKLTKDLPLSKPLAGVVAEFEHGANLRGRVTLTRVALTGVFALGLKKNRNRVYVAIQFPNGDQVLLEAKGKHEEQARQFTAS